jgi:sigma-B regulation protein RsbU (phosphoserine phosphatase)
VIADVMGKGVAAALFAAMLRSTIRSLRHLFTRPGELLEAVNQTLFADLSRVDMFITATVVYLDPERGGLISASAGHCPLLFSGAGAERAAATPTGLPLGIEADSSYRQGIHALPRGAAVLLYTDGLNEARNGAGEFLGEPGLRELFAASLAEAREAAGAKHVLRRRLEEFRGGAPLVDDQTFILIQHPA